jgi:hypothetical protein
MQWFWKTICGTLRSRPTERKNRRERNHLKKVQLGGSVGRLYIRPFVKVVKT